MRSTRRFYLSILLSICIFRPISALAEQPFDPLDATGKSFMESQQRRLSELNVLLEQIISTKGERTVDNTLIPYRKLNLVLSNALSEASLFSQVHPDKGIRDQALKSEQEFSKFASEKISLNRDLYSAIKAVHPDPKNYALTFFHTITLRDYRRAGVDRDEATRARIIELDDKIVEATQQFAKNLTADVRKETFKVEELDGLPEDYIKARVTPDKTIVVTTDYPDYVPIMSYAKSSVVKEKMYRLSKSRGYPQNIKPLEDVLKLRHERALLLGYKNWAEYSTEDKMTGKPEVVEEFFQKIVPLTKDRTISDYKLFSSEKDQQTKTASTLQPWEIPYYEKLATQRLTALDPQILRNYFPYEKVKSGVFTITEKLYGVKIEKVQKAVAWDSSVELYTVKDGKKELGKFYLDMFPRADKYKHAAQFTLRDGISDLQKPVPVLVCNFPKPSAKDPALMEHDDVTTFLHEFGHLLHSIFSGQNSWNGGIEWDFIEAPSQFFEEWAWNKQSLPYLSTHFKTKKPLPADLIEKMNRSRNFGLGYQTAVQLYYGNLSLNFYDRDPAKVDVMSTTRNLWEKFLPAPFPEGTYFPYSFGHLMGYSASYYTYMWSLVIAKDLFSEFEKEGIMSQKVAKRYRKEILESSGTRKANELIERFLNRPYSFEAFSRYLKS